MTARALIIAAPASGCGKTTVTLGLIGALRRRGIAVCAAKAGPDYIDPAFHTAASGAPSVNLDSWAMPPALIEALVARAASCAEILVIEGVMGLFDGVGAERGRSGATADLAAQFGIPVLLVLDVGGQAQSAAAVVRGFAGHDPGVHIAGVVLNRVGSERHRAAVADAIAAQGFEILGALPRQSETALPERHLGLIQAEEHDNLAARIAQLAATAEQYLDLDRIITLAATFAGDARNDAAIVMPVGIAPPGQRIALARDAAFSFVYPHLVDGWRHQGAELVCFSPLDDEAPPNSCDSCWLPGGYPELHAGRLAAAQRFHAGLRNFAATRPVHGECGGYMVLGECLEDAAGTRHPMTGLLSHATSFANPRLHLGYREARLLAESALGEAGTVLRGHEFHYAALISPGDDEPLAELRDAIGRQLGPAGGRRGLVTGAFFHVIAGSDCA